MLRSNALSSKPTLLVVLILVALLLIYRQYPSPEPPILIPETTSKWTVTESSAQNAAPVPTLQPPDPPPSGTPSASQPNDNRIKSQKHPIDDLIKSAQDTFNDLLRKKSTVSTLEGAAATYRKRRGRHPPPDFDKWYAFAQKNGAVVIEDLFDQIYHDLEPFWSLKPADLRNETLKWPFMFSIRDGKPRTRASKLVAGDWMGYWLQCLRSIPDLPDVDIAINALDEARVIVPWEDMNEHMKRAEQTKTLKLPQSDAEVVSDYPKLEPLSFALADIGHKGLKNNDVKGPWHQKIPTWELTRAACPPGSPGREMKQDVDFSTAPVFPTGFPNGSHQGYVSNWTESKNVCSQPHLANLYGTFVSPRFNSINTTLVPLFSGCKVHGINNEILLPAAKYFSNEEEFDFKRQGIPWKSKLNAIVWRGQATGGAHKKTNWRRFHRHRFIAMLNGSLVTREERTQPELWKAENLQEALLDERRGKRYPPPHNFPIPSAGDNIWNLAALKTSPTSLGEWIGAKTNAGFDHLMCAPWIYSVLGNGKLCGYMDPYYKAQNRISMGSQFKYKYLPDVDGNSYSGRYRAFLQSNSLPIKSTMWAEWHDSRLLAWKHFAPMDNTFVDFWGIMEYFLGYGRHAGDRKDPRLRKAGHDEAARRIAQEGKEWAQKVLRKEDMVVYTYRLILEYKRISSDERDRMVWVEDLL